MDPLPVVPSKDEGAHRLLHMMTKISVVGSSEYLQDEEGCDRRNEQDRLRREERDDQDDEDRVHREERNRQDEEDRRQREEDDLQRREDAQWRTADPEAG